MIHETTAATEQLALDGLQPPPPIDLGKVSAAIAAQAATKSPALNRPSPARVELGYESAAEDDDLSHLAEFTSDEERTAAAAMSGFQRAMSALRSAQNPHK